jgi:hypothetical protein
MTNTHETTSQLFNKLKTSQRPYVITGSQASFRYHRWLYPVPQIVELRIYSEDYGYWVNLLQGEAVYISETPPTTEMMKSFDVAVLLAKNLNAQICQNQRTMADLRYESAEDLCINFLAGLVTETPIMELLAILLIQRQTFKWEYFCKKAMARGLAREAGILLEVINEHTQQSLMPQSVIAQFFQSMAKNDDLVDGYFPHTWRVRLALKRGNERDLTITYPQTSQKWGVKVVLPRYIMDKLVLDLDYAWRNQSLDVACELENRLTAVNIVS